MRCEARPHRLKRKQFCNESQSGMNTFPFLSVISLFRAQVIRVTLSFVKDAGTVDFFVKEQVTRIFSDCNWPRVSFSASFTNVEWPLSAVLWRDLLRIKRGNESMPVQNASNSADFVSVNSAWRALSIGMSFYQKFCVRYSIVYSH